MLTVALSAVLNRGVTLGADEAVAIVQSVASSAGVPTIDNVEFDSDGVARCMDRRGTPTVAALAALLDALLPAAGVPAPLRYTAARAAGAVVAPPFASIDELVAALARFEKHERAALIRGLLARGAHDAHEKRPVRVAPAEPAADVVLERPPLVVRERRSAFRAWQAAAALAASAVTGFVVAEAVWPASLAAPASPPRAVVSPASPPQPRETAPPPATASGPIEWKPVRAIATSGHAFSPAFAPGGTALFFQTGGPHDPSSAIAAAPAGAWPADDLRIITLVNDGSRNYHAQPSPDGRLIAFDSDRDGERGIYVANRDGTGVHRVSGAGFAALPTWAPDGTRLAFVRADAARPSVWNLWVQRLDGTPARQLTAFKEGQTWNGSWFPDGRRIAFSHEDTLTILDIDSGHTRRFASPVAGRLVRTPAVSPDGTKIVFQVFHAGVWLLSVADGGMQCILADPSAEEFAWAPDGHRIAFHSRRGGQWGVFVLSRG
jgi:hypothetical protein